MKGCSQGKEILHSLKREDAPERPTRSIQRARRMIAEDIFRREILNLRSEYIAHGLAEVERMRSWLERQTTPRLVPSELMTFVTLAHRLRGSGQVYDLPQVTEWASILESNLRTVAEENDARITAEHLRSLLTIVDRLYAALKETEDRHDSRSYNECRRPARRIQGPGRHSE